MMVNESKLYGLSPILIYESFNDIRQHQKIKKIYYEKINEYGFEYGLDSRFIGACNSSGESLGKSFIHKDPDFSELFSFIKENIVEYITKLGFNVDLFSFHVLKSWYVIITENNGMDFHTHSGSDLSFCYYIDVPLHSGNINFLNQNTKNENINNLFSGLFDFSEYEPSKAFINDFKNPHTFYSFPFEPSEGKLLIFPSTLEHSVDKCEPGVVRHSISGDIKITLNKDIKNFESGLVHPSLWTEL